MKLYYVPKATVGQRWQGTQADAKALAKSVVGEFIQREVPVSKPELLEFLNAEESVSHDQAPDAGPAEGPTSTHGQRPLDPLEQAELRAVAAARGGSEQLLHYDYRTLDARSGLAAMDAGTIARQIEQFHGPDLGKIVASCIKRVSQLAEVAVRAAGGGGNG